MSNDRNKIVVIGGGSGTSAAIRGLKSHNTDLTAVVTMFDSGGSTGILRDEFGYPPFGDLRQCLVALSPDGDERTDALNQALGFRFDSDSSLNGHSVGNLVLAALTTAYGGLQPALDEISSILRVDGQVVPVTLSAAHLCARLVDGQVIRTESAIDLRGTNPPGIDEVFLDKQVTANDRAINALNEADAILLGPGDLYTSVTPNLLVPGIAEAIRESNASVIYACNLMTKAGETDGFGASDFAREIVRYLDGRKLDYLLVNDSKFPTNVLNAYSQEHAQQVVIDNGRALEFASEIVESDFVHIDDLQVRHDSKKLADVVMASLESKKPVS
ncbi:MAG: gluconeogenesis factor YvcK family protein [Dehalococcoidia bacterium]